MYLAHSATKHGHVDSVAGHLQAVAIRAAEYAKSLSAAEEAYLAGLLHDLGKYGDRFQARLRGEARGVDHWSAGACLCLQRYRWAGVGAALAIAGHHIGLGRGDRDSLRALDLSRLAQEHPLGLALSAENLEALLERMAADGLELPGAPGRVLFDFGDPHTAAGMLDVRMLYSVLVDADFVETEAHFEATGPEQPGYRASGPPLEAARALEVLTSYLDDLAASSEAAPEVKQMRRDLLSACLEAAEQPPGIFALTAPTGAGKTLSMLAFALRHAALHGMHRVVTVIPYLTIIEQTVGEYRKALAPLCEERGSSEYVLEDHSLAGLRREAAEEPESEYEGKARLLAENWDAPLVVTTSVQCLESLFSNRPSACRKLHRLARSVLLFDEVQTLPVQLAIPTLATLSRLAERYGATVLFSTATQPAFEHLNECVRRFCAAGWEPREIVARKSEMFAHARRAKVHWPTPDGAKMTWSDLAAEIAQCPQVLCIVNLKRHAWALLDELERRSGDNPHHLSTNMCPAHRQDVLAEVRKRLEQGENCCLVSTQCVEAGVDVDFPVVWRAWGPLDAVAQAAGRCNRNGRLPEGHVRLFVPETDDSLYPDEAYQQAASVAWAQLEKWGREKADIYDPEFFAKYYRELYDVSGLARGGDDKLSQALKILDFPEVARLYRVIRQDTVNVLVPYHRDRFRELEEAVYAEGLRYTWIQQARPYTVGLYRPRDKHPLWDNLQRIPLSPKGGEYAEDWFIWTGEYDSLRGLVPAQSLDVLIA